MKQLITPIIIILLAAALAVAALFVVWSPWEGDGESESGWSVSACRAARQRANIFHDECFSFFGEIEDQEACDLWNDLERDIANNCR